jgi:hypothetical protein
VLHGRFGVFVMLCGLRHASGVCVGLPTRGAGPVCRSGGVSAGFAAPASEFPTVFVHWGYHWATRTPAPLEPRKRTRDRPPERSNDEGRPTGVRRCASPRRKRFLVGSAPRHRTDVAPTVCVVTEGSVEVQGDELRAFRAVGPRARWGVGNLCAVEGELTWLVDEARRGDLHGSSRWVVSH